MTVCKKKILDATCGARTMWFDKQNPRTVFFDKRCEHYDGLWKSNGYSVDFWDGKWKANKVVYYDKSIAEMPVVCENKVRIHSAIDKAVIDTILGFVEVAKRGDDNADH